MKAKNSTREKLLDITFEEIYIHGYSATSIGSILTKASVPKGSMYHHFDSKKSLVLAMIKERLCPKMDIFFDFTPQEDISIYQSFKNTFANMTKHTLLITHGCPLYRLMVELSASDKEFDILLSLKYKDMTQGVEKLLQVGIDRGEFSSELNPQTFAPFFITSVWGVLSLAPSLSSPKLFLSHIKYILLLLDNYSTQK